MNLYLSGLYGEFNPDIFISFDVNRKNSWGGYKNNNPYISLAIPDKISDNYFEYVSFATNHKIGDLYHVGWRRSLGALIAHELSHAIQYYPLTKQLAYEKYSCEPITGHGPLWKNIYGDLREKFINIPDYSLYPKFRNNKKIKDWREDNYIVRDREYHIYYNTKNTYGTLFTQNNKLHIKDLFHNIEMELPVSYSKKTARQEYFGLTR